MTGLALAYAALGDKPTVDVSAHLDLATGLILGALGLIVFFFLVRPELWRRLWFDRVDPRPAAIVRIFFGTIVLWTFLDLLKPHGVLEVSVGRFLFTDDGLWLTDMARKNYGGQLKTLWDPEHGFEHWYSLFEALWGKFTVLHFRSDPAFVFTLYGAMVASLTLMIFGKWTRWTTVLSWILVETFYRYSPVFYTGGDTVVRVFLFLGMFARWGEAYSLDSLRWRRNAILRGAAARVPALRRIPAWPLRLMMLQLCIIYCATGLLKSGGTWANGTALYYALALDHFYRFPQQIRIATFMQWTGILPIVTVITRYWEVLFPLAAVGAALNCFEREKAAGIWPKASAARRWLGYSAIATAFVFGAYVAGLGAYYFIPENALPIPKDQRILAFGGLTLAIGLLALGIYRGTRRWFPRINRFIRHWLLGKRVWLVFGFSVHIGIDLGMNVGTFAEVMMGVYFAWLTGPELDGFWRYLYSRPVAPGEGGRPTYKHKWMRIVLAPYNRLRYRAPGRVYTVHHHPSDDSVRRAALLRLWDEAKRLEFESDLNVDREGLCVQVEGEKAPRYGRRAAAALTRALPGLLWLRPIAWVLPAATGAVVLLLLRQRG